MKSERNKGKEGGEREKREINGKGKEEEEIIIVKK